MRPVIYGSQRRRSVVSSRGTIKHRLLHLQYRMDPRQDKLYPMSTYILSQGKVVTLRRMMRYMTRSTTMRRKWSKSWTWIRKGRTEALRRWHKKQRNTENSSCRQYDFICSPIFFCCL